MLSVTIAARCVNNPCRHRPTEAIWILKSAESNHILSYQRRCVPFSSRIRTLGHRLVSSSSKPPTLLTEQKPRVLKQEKIVYLPGFVKATQLAGLLNTKLQAVTKFARAKRFKFQKHSEIILDWHHAKDLAQQLGFKPVYYEADAVQQQSDGNPANPTRPVVISVLGHVDHGKTTLLDALSDSRVAEQEPGRITQAVSAFLTRLGNSSDRRSENASSPYTTLLTSVLDKNGSGALLTSDDVATLLDTPGHAAFFKMREGGAGVSDFVLLVIAADEGIKEQTVESIKLLTTLRIPMIVAVNKVDIATEDQIERIYSQLKKMRLCVPKLTRKANPLLLNPPDLQHVPSSPRFVLTPQLTSYLNCRKMFDFVSEDHPVMAVCEISALKRIGLDTLKSAVSSLSGGLSDSRKPDIVSPKSPLVKMTAFSSLVESLKPAPAEQSVGKGPRRPNVPQPTAEAIVVESWVSAADGKVLLCITQRGAVCVGESFVIDRFMGRVRSIQLSDVRYVDRNPQIASSSPRNVKYALPGMPALLSVTLESHFRLEGDSGLPTPGTPLYQFNKEDAEAVYGYRNLMMQYKTKELSGQLFVADSTHEDGALEAPETQNMDIGGLNNIDSSTNPQVSPLSSPEAAELLKRSRQDIPATGRAISVVIRADNSGMLDAIVSAAKVITLKYGVHLRILRSGVGEVSPTDLWVTQVAIEENGEDKVSILTLNTEVGTPARQWIEKNKHKPFVKSVSFRTFNVFLDLISHLKDEIKLKFPDLKDDSTEPASSGDARPPKRASKKTR